MWHFEIRGNGECQVGGWGVAFLCVASVVGMFSRLAVDGMFLVGSCRICHPSAPGDSRTIRTCATIAVRFKMFARGLDDSYTERAPWYIRDTRARQHTRYQVCILLIPI